MKKVLNILSIQFIKQKIKNIFKKVLVKTLGVIIHTH